MAIKIPDYFKKSQEEATRNKIKEAEEKLNKFLEDEGLILMPIMKPMMDKLVCSFTIVPKEFLSSNKKKSEIIK